MPKPCTGYPYRCETPDDPITNRAMHLCAECERVRRACMSRRFEAMAQEPMGRDASLSLKTMAEEVRRG